jgi:hypothetical protein
MTRKIEKIIPFCVCYFDPVYVKLGHWMLRFVTFNEDSKRVRKENAPENLALLHKFAFNVLKMEKNLKRSLKAKKFKASLSLDYLEKVLNRLTN